MRGAETFRTQRFSSPLARLQSHPLPGDDGQAGGLASTCRTKASLSLHCCRRPDQTEPSQIETSARLASDHPCGLGSSQHGSRAGRADGKRPRADKVPFNSATAATPTVAYRRYRRQRRVSNRGEARRGEGARMAMTAARAPAGCRADQGSAGVGRLVTLSLDSSCQ